MRYTVKTKLDADKVYQQAEAFFGPEGNGMEMTEGTPGCCAHFQTNLGYVHMDIREEEKKTAVDLETHEYDIQVRSFMNKLPK